MHLETHTGDRGLMHKKELKKHMETLIDKISFQFSYSDKVSLYERERMKTNVVPVTMKGYI